MLGHLITQRENTEACINAGFLTLMQCKKTAYMEVGRKARCLLYY